MDCGGGNYVSFLQLLHKKEIKYHYFKQIAIEEGEW